MAENHIAQKIAELRNQKGLTQEELAAKCNINVRSIQRIEKGEVLPRKYTLKILSEALGYDLLNQNNETKPDGYYNGWIIGFYSSSLLAAFLPYGLIITLVILAILWQKYKHESDMIYMHGKNVINFQIVMLIYALILFCFLLYQIYSSTVSFSSSNSLEIGKKMEFFTNLYLKAYYIFIVIIVFYSLVNIILFLLKRKPFALAPNFVK